ncbi:MAG: aspartyl-tRNA(Asn)/glutamyl-tRNA(Gln) amidotransferase subunit [Solirubrobacterales bacterium]|nr:aspartyl-tRNA(Asn)/glutamyl-tRNA(Gln) amidotransferase subunit [Solirubrobacterales bacterium]
MSIWITRQETSASERKRTAVKDLFDTSGVRTTYGSEIFADHVPHRTAAAVEQLENAGYASAGKANLHEFAYGITSQNPHFGDVPNVRFPGYVAGGSSGGCAAAIAAGEADVALGTDTGGSIRIPAACCEVVGFKPTFGLVSLDGCFPLAPSFDHAGPLAKDVAGCAEMMRALVGLSLPTLDSLEDIRLGIAWLNHAETEVRTVIDAAASRLPPALPVEPSLPDGVFDAFQHEVAGTHRELFDLNRDRYGLNVRTKVERCLEVSRTQAARANAIRERYRMDFARATADVDIFVAPTLPIVPPEADCDELLVRAQMTHLTFPLNAIGAPALAIPCGRTQGGLPVSMQVVGKPGADGLVLAVGALIEAALRNTAGPEFKPI